MEQEARVSIAWLGIVIASVIAASCSSLVAPPTPTAGPTKFYRIGFISLGAKVGDGFDFPDTVERLRELGYIEGVNFRFVERHADNRVARLPELARELVDENVDVIIAATRPGVVAAKAATNSIPIVMTGSSRDPVGEGLVASLPRPGGNLTGLAGAPLGADVKRFDVLMQGFPTLARVMVLGWSPEFVDVAAWERSSREWGVELIPAEVVVADDIPAAFANGIQYGPQGAVVIQRANLSGPALNTIARLAHRYRLPTIAPWAAFAEQCGLFGYEARASEGYRRVADYVHRVLTGTHPSDLPVEEPSTYDLVFNSTTRDDLALQIAPRALGQVERVVRARCATS